MGGFDSVMNVFTSNKKNIEMLLTLMIVVSLMPNNILGMNLKSQLSPVLDPIQGFFRHNVVQLIVFLLLVYSCCIKVDMNMFLLLSVFILCCR